jgi:ABC-type branched-subunit amino acid transport system ATPase component
LIGLYAHRRDPKKISGGQTCKKRLAAQLGVLLTERSNLRVNKVLEINELDKSFGGVHAVNHVSFDLHEGEILGLIGPNGSGKSTTVNLVSGVNIQDSGSILFNGKSLKKQTIADRARLGIGRTFQSPRPFLGLTVWESVYTVALIYNKRKEAEKKTDEIIEMMGFTQLRQTVSSKLPIEKRKWLDMARAMAIYPKLIMLDECLAGLLPNEMEESIALIKRINETGVAILFIEHVMSAVTKLCHRLVVLNEGMLLCEGKPSEVMCKDIVIKAYLGEDYENVEN